MPHARRQFGDSGEATAATFLERRGYRVVARNVRMPVGELDLVCEQGRTIVFVEVKTRRSVAYGHPEEAVTPTKQRHLVRAAQAYLARMPAYRGRPHRIDVVAITGRLQGDPEIVHIPNAIGDLGV